MSKPAKIVLGIATVIPIVAFLGFFVIWIAMFATAMSHSAGGSGSAEAPRWFAGMMIGFMTFFFLSIVDTFVLIVIYVIDIFKNPRITSDYRVLWALIIFFGGAIGMIAYWYVNIWRTPPDMGARTLES